MSGYFRAPLGHYFGSPCWAPRAGLYLPPCYTGGSSVKCEEALLHGAAAWPMLLSTSVPAGRNEPMLSLYRCLRRRLINVFSLGGRYLAMYALAVFAICSGIAPAQAPGELGSKLSPSMSEPSLEKLREQIRNLNSPSYRTRQLAIWYLEQNGARAVPLLREAGFTTDLNIGAEVVSLLSSQAMRADPLVSVAAHEALKEIAGGQRSVTAVSHLANSALESIAARQEMLAKQSLESLGVELGPLRLTIGGAAQNEGRTAGFSNIVHVNDEFSGTDQDVRLFRFLRSYDTAYLEGNKITEPLLREVLTMPGLNRIVLRGPAITNELLTALFDVQALGHLELVYANVDDAAIDTIVDLPLVDSVRIFGTKISQQGAQRIKKELEGLDIYFGRGGFLGVQTNPTDLLIIRVVPGSGADVGGIQAYDVLTAINGKSIRNFPQLREELGNFAPNEKVSVTVRRMVVGGDAQRPGVQEAETVEIQLEVELGLQETPTN